MLSLPYVEPSGFPAETASPLLLAAPTLRAGHDPLRHILLGSPAAVEQAINRLHVVQYAEQFRWSRIIQVPPTGLVISPRQGEVMRYLICDPPQG
ncbi:hypothetical protein [Pseudanabaena sp. FACHB-2040]|uniref:hypothetical protein n=1 Tax=Pseudanabaena sp. FACHB-2040 TaxID=2692859 RepID=UPI001683512F|nr:hypothetical protein [Pseudanabaena sp. FACHB-2040]MBD2259128.1 hypothetical protein [Pseudanabaena sp. FACHB-2040]